MRPLIRLIVSDGAAVPQRRAASWAAATLVAFVALTYAGIYLTWSDVGATVIREVQGRYLLAGVPLVAWLCPPAFDRRPAGHVFRSIAWIGTLLFPLMTFATAGTAILVRYYGP
ncbi:MAG: hypothetical protein EXQ50_14220 [Acidobacteria bacterium]|nr:hypothetical protein [Acidobacteriota bacterium]